MASKCRTIDPALFAKTEFRRASYIQREVWLGIICTCCDDEGRFEASAWCLLERIFSRAHDATEQDVADALTYWQQAGWLLLYDDGRYGFLTGWFEHQYIRNNEASSCPRPPVLIASWADAALAKRWHTNCRGGKDNTHFRTVLTEYEQALRTDDVPSEYRVRTEYALTAEQVSPDRTGQEGNGQNSTHTSETASSELAADGASDAPPAPTASELRKRQRAELLASRAELLDSLPQQDRELIAGFLETAAAENARGTLTLGREVSETRALVELRATLDPDAWRYGLQQANAHRAPNLNYVRKAAGNWQPGQATPASQPSGLWRLAEDGTREYERTMQDVQIASIRQAMRDGTWDTERGMDRYDPRHPACPEAIRRACQQQPAGGAQ